jgi:hypothetical protein
MFKQAPAFKEPWQTLSDEHQELVTESKETLAFTIGLLKSDLGKVTTERDDYKKQIALAQRKIDHMHRCIALLPPEVWQEAIDRVLSGVSS